ncbi:MAG: hypothetical protein PVI09_18720 [Anaerolineae bacterium]|jgi:hypothetical protein
MKKVLMSLLLVCMVLAVASLPVYASKPTRVSGGFGYVPVCPEIEFLGGNTFMYCEDTEDWDGGLVGTATTKYWVIFHGELGEGPATFSSKGQFVGSVGEDGEQGTAEFQVTGILKAGAEQWQGTWWMGQGTEGLENVHAQGTWEGSGPFTYEGLVHFAP